VSDATVAAIDASTGVAMPSSTKTGTVTITATAVADTTKTATLQVNVVDWILAGPEAYITDSAKSFYTPLLTPNLSAVEEDCSWSHDHLGFVCGVLTAAGEGQFYIFKTDGTAAGTVQTATINLAIGNLTGFGSYPHFSPDGSKIVCSCIASGAGGSGFGPCVVNSNGSSAPVLLATDPDVGDDLTASPRFSPDGTRILFTLNDALWIMNSDGSNQRQLFAAPSTNGVFSADGTMIYFNGSLPSGQSGVIRANADGSDPAVIVSSSAGCGECLVEDVSPNGQSLLLGGNLANYTANPDGTGLTLIDGLSPGSWY
jgi:Tol biopolymer transport system component